MTRESKIISWILGLTLAVGIASAATYWWPAPVIPETENNGGEPEPVNEAMIETRINQAAAALGVRIRPLVVLEDSRCPAEVQCIWAGTVRVKALITSALGEAEMNFTLNQPVTTEAGEVTLMTVEPEPRAGVKIFPGDYRFTFQIKKR